MRKNMRAGVEYGFGKAAQQVDPAIALVGGKSGTAEHGAGSDPALFEGRPGVPGEVGVVELVA